MDKPELKCSVCDHTFEPAVELWDPAPDHDQMLGAITYAGTLCLGSGEFMVPVKA